MSDKISIRIRLADFADSQGNGCIGRNGRDHPSVRGGPIFKHINRARLASNNYEYRMAVSFCIPRNLSLTRKSAHCSPSCPSKTTPIATLPSTYVPPRSNDK